MAQILNFNDTDVRKGARYGKNLAFLKEKIREFFKVFVDRRFLKN